MSAVDCFRFLRIVLLSSARELLFPSGLLSCSSFLPKLWNQRPHPGGPQNPAVVAAVQQLDARRRAIDETYLPLNRFLSVPSMTSVVARSTALRRQDSCRTLSIEAVHWEEPEGERSVSGASAGGGGGRPDPLQSSRWPDISAGASSTSVGTVGIQRAVQGNSILPCTPSPPGSPAAVAAARAIRALAATFPVTESWCPPRCSQGIEDPGGCSCCNKGWEGGKVCCPSIMGASTRPEELAPDEPVCCGSLDRSFRSAALRSEALRYSCGWCSGCIRNSNNNTNCPEVRAVAAWVRRPPPACPDKNSVHHCGSQIQQLVSPGCSQEGGLLDDSTGRCCSPHRVVGASKCPANGCSTPTTLEEQDVAGGGSVRGLCREGVLQVALQRATEGPLLSPSSEGRRQAPWTIRLSSPSPRQRSWPAPPVLSGSAYSSDVPHEQHHDGSAGKSSCSPNAYHPHQPADFQQQQQLHISMGSSPTASQVAGGLLRGVASSSGARRLQPAPTPNGCYAGSCRRRPDLAKPRRQQQQNHERLYHPREQSPLQQRQGVLRDCGPTWEEPPPLAAEQVPQAHSGWWVTPAEAKPKEASAWGEVLCADGRPCSVAEKRPFPQPCLVPDVANVGPASRHALRIPTERDTSLRSGFCVERYCPRIAGDFRCPFRAV